MKQIWRETLLYFVVKVPFYVLIALMSDNVECYRHLIACGADPSIQNKHGKVATLQTLNM